MNRPASHYRNPAPTSRPPRRAVCWALLVSWFALSLGLSWGVADSRAASPAAELEYKVKGGYLFHFVRFIEWPAVTLPAKDSPFVIGVLDSGDALSVIQSLLETKNVDGHPVVVKSVTADQIGSGIHILFITRTTAKSAQEIRAAVGLAPTLIVGETEGFAQEGGMLGFTREGENIRLSLNLERTAEVGLKVSSKLSSVAKIVKTARPK